MRCDGMSRSGLLSLLYDDDDDDDDDVVVVVLVTCAHKRAGFCVPNRFVI